MATPIPSNSAPFTILEVKKITAGRLLLQGKQRKIVGVSTDTRAELSGKAYVALRGERFDGHRFLHQARQIGAALLIVEDGEETRSYLKAYEDVQASDASASGVSLLVVDDSLVALGQLAHAHRKAWAGRVIAVAGSAGKTTTRSVISALLEAKLDDRVHSTVGNLNNRIGVPMILLGLKAHHEVLVAEIGTNCPGEVAQLSQMVSADVAVLTLIDLEHTEGLGSLDGVEKEESEIFSSLAAGGIAIGFGEDERVFRAVQASGAARRLTYGFSKDRDLSIVSHDLDNPRRARLTLRRAAEANDFTIRSSLVGRPGALAVAAGLLAVETLVEKSWSVEECESSLFDVGEPGRSSVVELPNNIWIIDDSYNSNPVSVENSIETGRQMRQKCGGRLWLVLGEMLELGDLSHSAHLKMGELAASSGAEGAFFVQGEARSSVESAQKFLPISHFFGASKDVAAHLGPLLRSGDVVVVKASRGVRAERVVEGLRVLFASSAAPSDSSNSPAPNSSSGSVGFN